jgi:hypothetical protein
MTVGLPGAGIGGLFYLASTILLPLRSLVKRLRGQQDGVPWRDQAHSVVIAIGIIGALWMAGWLLSLVVPDELLTRGAMTEGAVPARSVLSMATLAVGVGTLLLVLLAVEIARVVHVWSSVRELDRSGQDSL